MATNTTQSDIVSALRKQASELTERVEKQAAELKDVKDPNNKGTVAIPSSEASDPAISGVVKNDLNLNTKREDSNITVPLNPVLEGKTPDVKNGDAENKSDSISTKSATALKGALWKFASELDTQTSEPKKEQAQPEKSASNDALNDADIQDAINKCANIGAFMLQFEEGRKTCLDLIERHHGVKAASDASKEIEVLLQKQASAITPEEKVAMEKLANARKVHEANISALESDFEKMAYAQGAQDAAAMAQAPEGAEPAVENQDLSPEEAEQLLAELVNSGEISQEAAQAILQAAESGDITALIEAAMSELDAAVQSGQLSEEEAVQVAQELFTKLGIDPAELEAAAAQAGGAPAPQEAAPAADPGMPAEGEPEKQASIADKAKSIVEGLTW